MAEKRYVKLAWKKCGWRSGRPGGRNQGFNEAESMTIGMAEMVTGHPVAPHTHVYEQVMFLPAGDADLILGDDVMPVHGGMMIAIPPELKHGLMVKGKETLINFDFFFPKRDDRVSSKLLPGFAGEAAE